MRLKTRPCITCRKVAILGLLAALALTTGCAPSAQIGRPACADKLALALTSTQPVPGAFACVSENQGADLHAAGISSDESWAVHNAADGVKRPPFVYEGRLHDGAYVYHVDIPTNGTKVTIDLIIWIARDGSVYNWTATSVIG